MCVEGFHKGNVFVGGSGRGVDEEVVEGGPEDFC